MRKVFLIVAGAALFSIQACKSGTADKDKTIDEGMNTTETSIGSDTTRLTDRKAGDITATKQSGTEKDNDTNSEKSNDPIETGATDQNDK